MKGRDVILGILNHAPRTGYEINDILKNQLSYFYDGTFGMIYPTLRKLESEGKIKKEQVIQKDKPNKKIYSITKKGRDDFEKYMLSNVDPESIKSDFLLRLYFGEDIFSKEQIINLFDQEIKRKQQQLDFIQKNASNWEERGMEELQKITLEYGISYYKNAINFLREKKKDLIN